MSRSRFQTDDGSSSNLIVFFRPFPSSNVSNGLEFKEMPGPPNLICLNREFEKENKRKKNISCEKKKKKKNRISELNYLIFQCFCGGYVKFSCQNLGHYKRTNEHRSVFLPFLYILFCHTFSQIPPRSFLESLKLLQKNFPPR